MSGEKLNFEAGAFRAFDAACASDDLAAFDSASGKTYVPAGQYMARLEAGELWTTRAGKQAYRLRFAVTEPAEHAGFTLWRYYTFASPGAANMAKLALSPLGIRSSVDLKRTPFPEPGRTIICKLVVGVQQRPDGSEGNDVLRFAVESDERTPPNPFAVPHDGEKEGGPVA